MPCLPLALLFACGSLVLAGCGDDTSNSPRLDVAAATSLKTALGAAAPRFDDATVRLSFAGSDQLAAQIRAGARPDVFSAANTKLPAALLREGLVEKPVDFATNQLVLAVPGEGTTVSSIGDLAGPGVDLAIGASRRARRLVHTEGPGQLPAGERQRILDNVRSEEPDVGGVVGKLSQGAVDAGFVYATDVQGRERAAARDPAARRAAAGASSTAPPSSGREAPRGRRRAFMGGLVNGTAAASSARRGS